MGMDVIVYTAHPSEARREAGMRFVSMEELLAQSDVISLHCPLTDGTRGMIDEQAIARMKDGAYVINTARGALVDGAAMAQALAAGKIAGYLADVLDEEPPSVDDPLLSAPHTVITPHVAWAAKQTRERLMSVVVENLAAYQAGEPRNVVSL